MPSRSASYGFNNPALDSRLFAVAAGRPCRRPRQNFCEGDGHQRRDAPGLARWPATGCRCGLQGGDRRHGPFRHRHGRSPLKRLGIAFTVYDGDADVGGTWLLNDQPGCGVGIANNYFLYAFERCGNWSRYYAKQAEIQAYLRDCVQR